MGTREILFLNCMSGRPSVSAALAAVGACLFLVRLNTAALKDANIDPQAVGAKLQLQIWDVSSATPVLVKTVASASIVGDATGTEWGTVVDLTTVILAAGTKHYKATWSLSGNVTSGGVIVLPMDTPAPCSSALHVVAT